MSIIEGSAWVFGDDVNTDEIIPARYLNTSDPRELALHCMEDIDPEFASKVNSGDIIVAGRNFGCGSSREHAPISIKAVGVSCVLADSFARIFFRNAINIGLPIIMLRGVSKSIAPGDKLVIDLSSGVIRNLTAEKELSFAPFPEFMQEIINKGGPLSWIREKGYP